MRLSLTKHEADMLLDAGNRMECDDIWQDNEYTEADGEALRTALDKLGAMIGQAESNKK